MSEETKIKSALVGTFCALVLCLMLVILKFIIQDENFVEQVYKYLASDIVFLK